MWRATTKGIVLGTLLWSTSAHAQCLAPLSELQKAAATADDKRAELSKQADDTRSKSETASKNISQAIAAIAKARAGQKAADLDRAVAELSAAQKAYDAAASSEQALTIARLETDRIARGAKQAWAETLLAYQRQGNALLNAVERARRGEVVPSLTDMLACEQGECGRISEREQAALITIGAIAETLDPQSWPTSGRECDFTLISAITARKPVLRNLLATQKETAKASKDAEAAFRAARQSLATAAKERDDAVIGVLEAHGSPASNSHADELLGMAIETLIKQNAALPAVTDIAAAADAHAATAKEAAIAAESQTQRHLGYWGDIGRAVVAVSLRLERGSVATAENDSEAAALAVMGADPARKAKTCLLETTPMQKGRVTFTPVPAPKC